MSVDEPRNGWTLQTLRQFLEAKMEAHEKQDVERHQAGDRAAASAIEAARSALAKAEIASEKRFDALNEMRQMVSDRDRTFLPRQEYSVQHNSITEIVSGLAQRLERLEGRSSGMNAGWLVLGQAVAMLAALAAILLAFLRR